MRACVCVHVCVFRIADEIEIVRGGLQRLEKTGKTEVPLGAGESWAGCWLDRIKGVEEREEGGEELCRPQAEVLEMASAILSILT